MARYRSKDSTDITWNKIRRHATRELDTQIADWREIALDTILSALWTQYAASLSSGETLELEASYSTFVSEALDDALNVTVDAPA